jgi:ADP-ribosyl-[dinitrogen reductase] hydrolase
MSMRQGAGQDSFLGALLGMAIGDALGMPVAGMTSDAIRAKYGQVDRYLGRKFEDGAEIKPGEFTDESEIALCVVESLTTNQGLLDPDNIGARMLFLAKGESKRWMGEDTLSALNEAESSLEFEVPIDEDGPSTGEVATRGVPIGLLHAIGHFDETSLRADSETVTRLTHGSPAAIAATTAVAFATQLAAQGEVPAMEWASRTADFLSGGALATKLEQVDQLARSGARSESAIETIGTGIAAAESVSTGFLAAVAAADFESAVLRAVNAGGAADTRGAIAGALYGAMVGVSGIPQRLIDGLESRIYVSLAAPWFYKVALRRSGQVIDFRPRFDSGQS